MYLAGLGRFCSRDPIGYEAGANVFEYVGSRPLGSFDPLGLERTIHKEGSWWVFRIWADLEYDCDASPKVVEAGVEGAADDVSAVFWGWSVKWSSVKVDSVTTYTRTVGGRKQKRYDGMLEGIVHLQFVLGIKLGPIKGGFKPDKTGKLAMYFDTGWFDCGCDSDSKDIPPTPPPSEIPDLLEGIEKQLKELEDIRDGMK